MNVEKKLSVESTREEKKASFGTLSSSSTVCQERQESTSHFSNRFRISPHVLNKSHEATYVGWRLADRTVAKTAAAAAAAAGDAS